MREAVKIDPYVFKVAVECERVLVNAQAVRTAVEELLRRPYGRHPLPLLPWSDHGEKR